MHLRHNSIETCRRGANTALTTALKLLTPAHPPHRDGQKKKDKRRRWSKKETKQCLSPCPGKVV